MGVSVDLGEFAIERDHRCPPTMWRRSRPVAVERERSGIGAAELDRCHPCEISPVDQNGGAARGWTGVREDDPNDRRRR
jgi:hypothetical protein